MSPFLLALFPVALLGTSDGGEKEGERERERERGEAYALHYFSTYRYTIHCFIDVLSVPFVFQSEIICRRF